jgi:hypothetical protein
LEAIWVAVDHDKRLPERAEVLDASTAHPAATADDDVSGHPVDLAIHPPPPHVLAQVSLDKRLEQDTKGVQRGSDTYQDEHDGEQLTRCRQRVDLTETDSRDRGNRLVDRVENSEPEDDVADGSSDEHQRERQECSTYPSQWVHLRDYPPQAALTVRNVDTEPVTPHRTDN